MSTQALSWVFDHSETSGVTRLVMIGIANHVDRRGDGWAYVDEVRRVAKCSEKSYHRAVRDAVDRGELEVDLRGGGRLEMKGGYRPNRYIFPKMCGGQPDQDTGSCGGQADQGRGGQPDHLGGGQPDQDTPTHIRKDPSLTRQGPSGNRTQFPDTWKPKPSHEALASERDLDMHAEAEQFEDHHRAKGSLMKDWDRAFNTWLRNADRFSAKDRKLRVVGNSDEDMLAAYGLTRG